MIFCIFVVGDPRGSGGSLGVLSRGGGGTIFGLYIDKSKVYLLIVKKKLNNIMYDTHLFYL